MRASLSILLLLLFSSAFAAPRSLDPELIFDQGNKAYEQGKYREAIAAYETIAASGATSVPLLFNLGNASFKAGQFGRAIFYYRQAEQRAPRDRSVQANLKFAEKTAAANGAPPSAAAWERPFKLATLNEATLLWLAFWWIWLAAMSLNRIRPAWRLQLRRIARISGTLSLLLICWLAAALYVRFGRAHGVIISSPATVRYGPLQESQPYFSIPNGAEIEVLDHRNQWIQIKDSQNRVGWVLQQQLLPLPRG